RLIAVMPRVPSISLTPWANHTSVVQAMILPSWSRISWPIFPDWRIENGPWIAHPVEDRRRLVGVPNPEIRSGMAARSLADITLGECFRAGPAIFGAQAKPFEPAANNVAADAVHPAKLREWQ